MMKKICLLLVCFILPFILFGCSSQAQISPTKNNSAVSTNTSSAVSSNGKAPIKFADPAFEKYTRTALGKLSGDIYESDLAPIKQLAMIRYDASAHEHYSFNNDTNQLNKAFMAFSDQEPKELLDFNNIPNTLRGVTALDDNVYSLEDLKYFSSVVTLAAGGAANIDFIKTMPNLKFVYVEGDFHDLSAFDNCSKLEEIELDSSNITDFSPLEKLPNLKKLNVSNCEGSDKWNFSPRLKSIMEK